MKVENRRVDLHTHTNASDGRLSPEELIAAALAAGLSAVALTDHDTLEGYKSAVDAGKKAGIEIIPAIEFSTLDGQQEHHLLGYFLDPENEKLHIYLKSLEKMRLSRAYGIIAKLEELGHKIPAEDVLEVAGHGTVTRPHIAEVMVKHGIVKSYKAAFDQWIGDGRPACVSKFTKSIYEMIQFIRDIGGVSVLAHPGKNISTNFLHALIDHGLDGIEVVHPRHKKAARAYLQQFADANKLIATGGSDFHGGRKEKDVLGEIYVSYDVVRLLKKRSTYESARLKQDTDIKTLHK